jgi:hypothetical protein
MKKIKIKNPEEWVRDEYFDAESGDWQRYSYSEAMKLYAEYYHKEKLRKELIAYDKYISTHYWDGEIPSIEKAVDMYLKSR